MGTINEKLDYLATTKSKIKAAIMAKGVAVDDATTFRQYADKITSIPQEGGTTQKISLAGKATFDNSPSTGAYDFAESIGMYNFDMSKTKELNIKNYTVTGLTNDDVNGMRILELSDSKFNANDISGNTALGYFFDVNTSNFNESITLSNKRIGVSSIHPNADGTYNGFVFDVGKYKDYKNIVPWSIHDYALSETDPKTFSFNLRNGKLTILSNDVTIASSMAFSIENDDIGELEINNTTDKELLIHFNNNYSKWDEPKNKSTLKKVTSISEQKVSLNSKYSSSFRGCTKLTTFKLPYRYIHIEGGDCLIPIFDECENLTSVDLFGEPSINDYELKTINNFFHTYYFRSCPKLTTIKLPKIKYTGTTTTDTYFFGSTNSFEGKVTVYLDATWKDYIVKQFANTGVPESQYEIITY